jgi:chromate transporter
MNATITDANKPAESPIAFWSAFRFWLKLGFISFGGPAGQIAIMHDELVTRRRWISDRRFLHALNYAMLLPGPEAQQLATYIGWLMHGIRGGIIAGLLFVLPSFFILGSLAWLYLVYGDLSLVQGLIYGIKPAVTAIVVFAAVRIGKKALAGPVHWALAALAFVAIMFFKVPFPWIVLTAGLTGFALHRFKPGLFASNGDHGDRGGITEAVIGDDTPPPGHALFTWPRTMTLVAVGLGIWAAVMLLLFFQYGWDGTLTRMGWFFTKAAMVTIGGAYAVLPYVYQGGVETYGWLTGPQMIDGLALGETTPGPLIMVVTFVGFVGGWTAGVLGIESVSVAAWLGAAVATFFTFLPSFIFILAGGPAVESTRDNLGFSAPLGAITAAVVGVILNLAVFFGLHVLWPDGMTQGFEWFALVIGILAFVALWRYKANVIVVILVSAGAGVLIGYFLQ